MQTETYAQAKSKWPREGKHILASFDDDTIVVYQAYNREIATYAAANKKFEGCASFSPTRMTWIKSKLH
jgi:hypothetical protein